MKNQIKYYSRRNFIKQNTLLGAGTFLTLGIIPPFFTSRAKVTETPAILGGSPAHVGGWPGWPQWDPSIDEMRLIESIRSGVWSRASLVNEFEEAWAKTVGTKGSVTSVNGTNALITALACLDIGAGDEVIVGPYTYIATIQAILMNGAMPVFVDTDRETFQIDPAKIVSKITSRTKAILPVHILGLPADMPYIMKIADAHDLLVVEDACQAWKAEINGQHVGTFGHAGCFSFQNSKHLPMGEGGAIVSNDELFLDRCHSYQNFGFPYGSITGEPGSGSQMLGTKLLLTEYQAAIGLAQLGRLEEQSRLRNENAAYLKSLIAEIPGILPYRLYDHVTQAAFHLFPFRFQKEEFEGLPRADFLRALNAEGVPCYGGYTPLNDQPYLRHAFQTKLFRKIYPESMLDIDQYLEDNRCPENDKLCNETVWLSQRLLLGTRSDMDDIAVAILKIQRNASKIQSQS